MWMKIDKSHVDRKHPISCNVDKRAIEHCTDIFSPRYFASPRVPPPSSPAIERIILSSLPRRSVLIRDRHQLRLRRRGRFLICQLPRFRERAPAFLDARNGGSSREAQNQHDRRSLRRRRRDVVRRRRPRRASGELLRTLFFFF